MYTFTHLSDMHYSITIATYLGAVCCECLGSHQSDPRPASTDHANIVFDRKELLNVEVTCAGFGRHGEELSWILVILWIEKTIAKSAGRFKGWEEEEEPGLTRNGKVVRVGVFDL